MSLPTREQLLEAFAYEPETGVFTRANNPGRRWKPGQICGATGANGYVYLSLRGMRFLSHRAAWLMVIGEVPANDIDHINGDRSDNRIDNLRILSRSKNCSNNAEIHHATGRSVGGFFNIQAGKWQARIRIDGRSKHLGFFESQGEANAAYRLAKAIHHPHAKRVG